MYLQGAAKESLLAGDIVGGRADPARERPEEVWQKLVLVIDVRQVALAREDVERRHYVMLTIGAEPAPRNNPRTAKWEAQYVQ